MTVCTSRNIMTVHNHSKPKLKRYQDAEGTAKSYRYCSALFAVWQKLEAVASPRVHFTWMTTNELASSLFLEKRRHCFVLFLRRTFHTIFSNILLLARWREHIPVLSQTPGIIAVSGRTKIATVLQCPSRCLTDACMWSSRVWLVWAGNPPCALRDVRCCSGQSTNKNTSDVARSICSMNQVYENTV